MSARKYTIALGLLAALATPSVMAQATARDTLVEQGNYWQNRGDYQRAAEVWAKLLLVSPNDPLALYGLGAAELDKKNLAGARDYLARLRRVNPTDPRGDQLEQDIYFSQPGPAAELNQARTLAVSGEMDAAVAQYDKAFQGRKPQGPLAFEYFRYLGYSSQGLDRAISELEKIHRANPNNPTYELALAQHLVRKVERRQEGLQRLQRLSGVSAVSSEANETWRNVLTWIGAPGPAYRPFFQAYLQGNPDDTEIRQLMQRGGTATATGAGGQRQGGGNAAAAKPWKQDPELARGFAALEADDLEAAETAFRNKLKTDPNNADALGGLGVVRMQQNDLRQAEQLLERAARSRAQWRKALATTRYWIQVNAAASALGSGNTSQARRHVDAAIKLDGKDPAARNMLGRVQVEEGRLEDATRTFAQVFNQDRQNTEALVGLIGVLAQRGQPEKALEIIEKLTPEQRAEIQDIGRLRAAVAAGQAKAAEQRGDDESARLALEDAVRTDPDNPWLRFDLARLYLKTGATTEAQGLVDGLLVSNPDMPDALYSSALLSMQMGAWEKAHATLLRIPESKRTPAMASLEHKLWINAQSAQASRLAKQGQDQAARQILVNLEPEAGQDPELLGAIAMAWTDTGEPGRGLSLLRQLISRSSNPGPSLMLPYGSLLLKTGQDVEAAGVLRSLQNQRLTPAERQSFDNLLFLYTVRQADLLRERGDLVAAYDTLAPALAQRPNDTLALGALARMYAAGGEHAKALEYYQRLLAKDPDNAELQIGAAMVATEMRDYKYADTAINHAVALAPDNPEILATAARLYRARGKTSEATKYFNAAIAAEERQLAGPTQLAAAGAASAGQVGEYDNPFVGLPGQRVRSTLPPQALADVLDQEPANLTAGTALAATSAGDRPRLAQLPQASSRVAAQTAYPSPVQDIPAPQTATTGRAARQRVPVESETVATVITAPLAGSAQNQDMRIALPAEQQASAELTLPSPATLTLREQQVASGTPGQQSQLVSGLVSPRLSALRQELAELQESRNPEFRVGAFVRSNNGEDGMSRISEVSTPVEVRLPAGDGMVALRATPVRIDAGKVGSDYYSNSRFGGGPIAAQQIALANTTSSSATADDYLNAANAAAPNNRQRDSGVGLSVGYETRGLRADIGTTPLGFERRNLIGGVKFDGLLDERRRVWYSVDVSRRAVTDSLLSFAGTTDSRTGQSWGGVTATGVQFQLGRDGDNVGYYGYGGWHALRGHNVASNWRANVGVGTYWHLLRERDRTLTAGLNLAATFHDKNLRFYTYGHGGYFSPQSMYALSVPVTWAQRSGPLSYKLQGSIGIQHFDEKGSDYFPNSSTLQAQAEEAAAWARSMGLAGATARYSGQSSTGLGYNLSAAAEYRLGGNFVLGGTVALNNATDYRQWSGGLYLRYTMYQVTSPMDLPVTPYRSPYAQ